MATEILIKRSGSSTVPTSLKLGEPAYTYEPSTGGRLYIGAGGADANGYALDIVSIGGQYYTDKLSGTPGTLTANSAIIVDNDSKIDIFKVDTFTLDGSTLSVSNTSVTDLNLTLSPQGAGSINVSSAKIINVAAPTVGTDAANKTYVDEHVAQNATNFIEGEGINISANTTTGVVTISAEYASYTNPGIASFNSTDFTVGGTGAVTVNAITLGTSTLNPGETTTGLSGLTSLNVDSFTFDGNTVTSTGDLIVDAAGAVSVVSPVSVAGGDANVSVFEVVDSLGADLFNVRQNGDVVIGGVLTVNGAGTSTFTGDVNINGNIQVDQGATVNATLTANTMTVTGDFAVSGNTDIGNETTDSLTLTARIDSDVIPYSNNTHSLGISGVEWADIYTRDLHVGGILYSDDITASNVTIAGNLIVEGTTTTVNTETINLADNIINLNSNLDAGTAPSQDAGFEVNRGSSPAVSLVWNETTDKWTVGSQTFVAATFEGALSGNASTATALQTARTFSLTGDVTATGVSFDGTGNVVLSTTIAPNSVALGTDTTGNYVATISATAGTGITISGSGSETAAVTIAGINATTSVKGVASFDSANFTVTAGAVAITTVDGGSF